MEMCFDKNSQGYVGAAFELFHFVKNMFMTTLKGIIKLI